MTPAEMQLASLILAAGAALLNIILIPLVKSSLRGTVVELVAEHNEDQNSHPARTMAAREEVSKVANNAQEAVVRVATFAQEAAAKVAATAETAAARVASNAQDAVVKVHDGIESQFEKIRQELRAQSGEIVNLRLKLAGSQHGRIRKTEKGASS